MTFRLLHIILTFIFLADLKGQSDTTNRVDKNGKKQGYWVHYFNGNKKTCADSTRKKADGFYMDNKKQGKWTEYYCSGKIKGNISYADDNYNGPFKFYNEKGTLVEEGTMQNKKVIGYYKRFDQDGLMQDYRFYNKNGKTDSINLKGRERTGDSLFKYDPFPADIYDKIDSKKIIDRQANKPGH